MNRLAGLVAASLVAPLALSGCRRAEDPPPAPPAPPVAVALPADGITARAATLHGTLDPAGSAAVGWLEWGTDAALSSPSASAPVALGSGSGAVPISAGLAGLAPGTTYWFRAAGSNAAGMARGEARSFTTAFVPAQAVTLAAAPGGTAAATLHGGVDPVGSAAEGWFEWGTDPALAAPAETPRVALGSGEGAVATSAALSGLAPGTTYWFRAVGANAGGTVTGEILSFTTAFLAPDLLTLPADGVGTGGATLHATANPAGSAAEGWFEWGTDAALTAATGTAHLALGSGTAPVPFSAILEGLRPGVTYWFRAAGSSAGGTVRGDIASFTTAFRAPGVATLAAAPVAAQAGTLRGTVDPAGTAAEGWFEWGVDPTLAGAAETPRVALGSGEAAVATSAAVGGLAGGTTYFFRAVGANAGGTARGEIRSFVAAFSAPGVVTRGPDAILTDGATLHAEVNPAGLDAQAWFEWSVDPSLASPVASAPVAIPAGSAPVAIALPVSGLAPGTTCYYRAVASSAAGTTRGALEWFGVDPVDPLALVVNSAEDRDDPPPGKLTLRAAIARLPSGGTITFAPGLDGATIALSIVGEPHSVLKGEVYGGVPPAFLGFLDRDLGRSALHAAKSLTIDASSLPNGVSIAWAGGAANPARVLAVYGDLTMRNVSITSGNAVAEPIAADAQPIPGTAQPYTLARGGGLAVWGTARLASCVVSGNRVEGDAEPSRDRGAFGGGIYADALILEDSIVSGNSATGYGAAGGGIYSLGGIDVWLDSSLSRCSVTGNRVTGQHAYGGGVFSDGGGVNWGLLTVENCTIARNLVEDHPGIADAGQYYTRGGGIYASNGTVSLRSSTVVENVVSGHPATFSGRPNLGGGGMAATIGNAHVVERMELQHSVVAGNTLNGAAEDVFTGSLIEFYGWGHNLVGRIDWSRILVPIPEWQYTCRRHWPKADDRDGVALAEAVAPGGVHRSASIVSVGADAGERAVLWYEPGAAALGQVPPEPYPVTTVSVGYAGFGVPTDDFLNHVLAELRRRYGVLGDDFGAGFGDLSGVTYYGPMVSWPSDPRNAAWIAFWRDLDVALAGRLGQVGLGDDFWAGFPEGPVGAVNVTKGSFTSTVARVTSDQLGNARPPAANAAVGAVEPGAPTSAFWVRAESGAAP